MLLGDGGRRVGGDVDEAAADEVAGAFELADLADGERKKRPSESAF